MSVLVTGGAGYIGSVTAALLVERGEKVVVLDDLLRGHRDAVPSGVPLEVGRVGDAALVRRIVREQGITECIHFAAVAYVGESVQEPRLYFERNVADTIALVGALLDEGVKRFVFSSSCTTYGEPAEIPIPESHPQDPTNPYGWSKLFVEKILRAYDAGHGLRTVALRYFNAAGGRERHDPETHLIPLVLDVAAGKRSSIAVFGSDYPTPDGTAIRDYIHVDDLASAHALALDHLRRGGGSEFLNLGTGRGHSVREVIETAKQVTGRPIPAVMQARRIGDPARLVAGAGRATEVLGWRPRYTDLAAIIESAWRWRR